MTILWNSKQLSAALGVSVPPAVEASGVSIDSRTLAPGDLFIALSGAGDPRYRGASGSGRDGHDFVRAAAEAGASAAIVARSVDVPIAQIVVSDPFDALWQLARTARARMGGIVFAITGSSGKTTAKALLKACLRDQLARVHAAEASLNNHIGVPLSLARMPADSRAAVFEIGMNSPGEIAPLSHLVQPDCALVLNVLPVHLEGLGSIEAIAAEKLSIAAGLGSEGTLVLHEKVTPPPTPDFEIMTFGRGAECDVRLVDTDASHPRVEFADGLGVNADSLAPGPHRRETATAVLAMLHTRGLDMESAVQVIRGVAPPSGRGAVSMHGSVRVIDDSYNANPESMRHALAGLREFDGGRFALLGEMLELGDASARMHAELADACAGLDGVFTVGEGMHALYERLPAEQQAGRWSRTEDLELDRVMARLAPGDTILLKGSNRTLYAADTAAQLTSRLDARPDG